MLSKPSIPLRSLNWYQFWNEKHWIFHRLVIVSHDIDQVRSQIASAIFRWSEMRGTSSKILTNAGLYLILNENIVFQHLIRKNRPKAGENLALKHSTLWQMKTFPFKACNSRILVFLNVLWSQLVQIEMESLALFLDQLLWFRQPN